jgi:quinol-cytochrome oxidoreductase complex cytochrome b subunit
MNYSNVIGFFLLVSFIIQFCSGMLLSIYYEDYYMICFDSVVFITCEVSNGWFVRLLHVLGATLFMLFVYFHWIRGSWLMFRLFYKVQTQYWIWLSGWLIFICSLIEGFLGYILNWGQMSYWGITVMINILSISY